ncbi:MAG TPA: hypothetical protein VFL57_09490, partial [Bryobacteraceae bacterium]|nr:hypothetical protein [Bryobacteraceae bacterium]
MIGRSAGKLQILPCFVDPGSMATTVTAAQVREDTAPGRSRKSTKSPPEFFLVLWGLALTGIVLAHAQRRLWYDEIYSYYMGLLPDLRTVLSALAGGGDLNPILFQLATRASLWTLGPSAGAARVPALVGFLVMSLCLYRVVRRRLGWQYGLVAMAIPAVTGAFRYAWEARPYGM